jgi:hypothetical protein
MTAVPHVSLPPRAKRVAGRVGERSEPGWGAFPSRNWPPPPPPPPPARGGGGGGVWGAGGGGKFGAPFRESVP